jgi:hypothetical protein
VPEVNPTIVHVLFSFASSFFVPWGEYAIAGVSRTLGTTPAGMGQLRTSSQSPGGITSTEVVIIQDRRDEKFSAIMFTNVRL